MINVRALVTDAWFAPLADVTLAVGSGLVLLVGALAARRLSGDAKKNGVS